MLISRFAYTYDNAGNRHTVTEDNGDVVTWTYDNANQLIVEERSGANAYHNNGNLTFTNANITVTTNNWGVEPTE